MISSDRIEQCLRRLRESKEVVYDSETSGLDFKRCHIVGHVFTYGPAPDDSYYLPVRHGVGGNIPGGHVPQGANDWNGSLHPLEKEIVPLLNRKKFRIIGHHLSFDTKFLHRIGVDFSADFEDTMLNQVLLNEWQPSVSLDACCKVHGVPQKKAEIYDYIASKVPEAKGLTKNAMGWYWKLAGDDPVAVEYAEQDGTSTWGLLQKQRVELELQNLQLVHSVECRVIPVLARMMVRGIKIDEVQLAKVKSDTEAKIVEAKNALPSEFNTRAPTQVRSLMEKNGHTDWPMTKPSKAFPKGQPSFNEGWLAKSQIGKRIVDLRKLENLLNSFINPMIETHLFNGRVYPEYHQLRGDEYGTVTGRLSSSNPNLQQVNKRNEELGRLHRSIFVPDEGMLWGSADYSQMEPRLLAYYSDCTALLTGYRADPPIDAHETVGKDTGLGRELGKRINQTLITGGGRKPLVEKYNVPADKVDEYLRMYFEKFPEIRTLQRQASFKMSQKGYVVSLLGRRCRLNDPGKIYVAVNRLLQTGNADCLKVKICEIDEYLRSEGDDKCNLLSNCHDAFEFQYADRRVYDGALKIMTSFGEKDLINLPLPIVVDHKEGKNWAEATYG